MFGNWVFVRTRIGESIISMKAEMLFLRTKCTESSLRADEAVISEVYSLMCSYRLTPHQSVIAIPYI